MARDVVR